MFEWRKKFHEKEYQKGQEGVAEDLAAQDAEARQKRLQRVATVAEETIDQANQLAADGDPHKQQLAALLKAAAVGAVQQAKTGQLPAEGRGAVEADPFSNTSPPSETSLPGSTPKALPHEQTEPPKRKRGRPRKSS